MNTTVEDIQKYIKDNYNLDFKKEYIGTHRYLTYKNRKKEYEIYCDYAYSNLKDPNTEYWSIYEEFTDKKEWYGSGSARVDEGFKTLDEIMNEWGFKKEKQLTIFDVLEEV